MMIEVLKSKIHCVTVTEANLNYMGSITIDEDLMDAANMIAGEKVQIVDNNNGERFETYIIKGERGSGCICLNGAAARKVQVGDVVIIMSYALMDFEEAKSFKPSVIFPDTETNRLLCVGGCNIQRNTPLHRQTDLFQTSEHRSCSRSHRLIQTIGFKTITESSAERLPFPIGSKTPGGAFSSLPASATDGNPL